MVDGLNCFRLFWDCGFGGPCLWFLPTETCELSYAFLRGHMLGKIIGISREPVAKGHLLGHWRFFGERNDMEVVRVHNALLQVEDQ